MTIRATFLSGTIIFLMLYEDVLSSSLRLEAV